MHDGGRMKLLHLSDLHFQTDLALNPFGPLDWRQLFARAEFVWQGRPALFRNAGTTVRDLLAEALAKGADHLLVTGDLSAIGTREELEQARASLTAFEGRLTVIPGNHDRTSRRSAANFESVFGDLLRSDLPELSCEGPYPFVHLIGGQHAGGLAIIGLDSGRVPRIPGVSRGSIGPAQLSALERILEDARVHGRSVVIAVHHAPFKPDGTPDRWVHGLQDTDRLLAIADAHHTSVICHGHIHHRFKIERAGRTPLFCAGSSTQRAREGYWLLDLLARDPNALQAGPDVGPNVGPTTGPIRATSRPPSAAER